MRRKTGSQSPKKMIFSALLSALSFVLMYFGALTGVMDLCAVVAGALLCAFAVIELRSLWPWMICTVTGALCLLLLPDKFMALEYITLGGIYPILKAYFEKCPRAVSWALKIASFNVMLTACLAISKFVLGIPTEEIGFSVVVYAVANAFFVFFDYALSVFIGYYFQRLRHRLHIRFE